MYKLSKLAAGSVIAAAAALGSAGVALADGYAPKKVAYERPADWSGVYFGVSSGYQWSTIDRTNANGFLPYSVEHDSLLVGGHLGLQHQFGNIVLGVEGSLFMTSRDGEGSTTCPGNPSLRCTYRLDDILTVGGRLGWAAGHWMPYLAGGYANAAYHYKTVVIATNNSQGEAESRHSGWYLGGGFDWVVSPGWTMGIEYRHYEFDTRTHNSFGTGGTTPGSVAQGVLIDTGLGTAPTTDTLMARVSWRFGREVAAPLK